MKIRKYLAILLIIIFVFSDMVMLGEQGRVEASEIPSIPETLVDPSGSPNRFYFVAMFYYDIWQENDGSWDPASPGEDVAGVQFPYVFDLPGRKIQQVSVNGFNKNFVDGNRSKWETVYYESRYQTYEWESYEDRTSLQHGATIQNLSGIGTSTVSFDLGLTSPSHLNATAPEEMQVPGGNHGERYYFPMLLTIDVEPQIIVKHFTTTGESLNSIFTDTVEIMNNGTVYQKVPPTHANYAYAGHKKSTTGNEPTGSIQSGVPPSFIYDNTFNTYMLYLYYNLNDGDPDGPDNPDDPDDPDNPVSPNIIATFEVDPSTIEFRDPFTLRPINIDTDTCTYASHQYRVVRGNSASLTSKVYSKSQSSSFSYAAYPSVIATGSHTVYIKVFTSDCGETDWISPDTLHVTDPSGNHPPDFQVGWLDPYTGEKKTTVRVGTTLDLLLLEDPAPSDPDGDSIEFLGFDTAASASTFVRGLSSQYDETDRGFFNITMTTVGTHAVQATMRDRWGAATTRMAVVTVVPPNPVPVITASEEVVEGRPLDFPFTAENSYSPMGRSIDHSRDEWTNKREIYDNPGEETIQLHVYDVQGLKSLNPATHTLTVKEDLPPVPLIEYADRNIRNNVVQIQNSSYSPDGDEIVQTRIRYRYDSDNDGNFAEEGVVTLILNEQGRASLTPNRIGRYQLEVYTQEDWGKEATAYFDLEIVNDAPYVSFSASGEVEIPQSRSSLPISNEDFFTAKWTANSLNKVTKGKFWAHNTTAIVGTKLYDTGFSRDSHSSDRGPYDLGYKAPSTSGIEVSSGADYNPHATRFIIGGYTWEVVSGGIAIYKNGEIFKYLLTNISGLSQFSATYRPVNKMVTVRARQSNGTYSDYAFRMEDIMDFSGQIVPPNDVVHHIGRYDNLDFVNPKGLFQGLNAYYRYDGYLWDERQNTRPPAYYDRKYSFDLESPWISSSASPLDYDAMHMQRFLGYDAAGFAYVAGSPERTTNGSTSYRDVRLVRYHPLSGEIDRNITSDMFYDSSNVQDDEFQFLSSSTDGTKIIFGYYYPLGQFRVKNISNDSLHSTYTAPNGIYTRLLGVYDDISLISRNTSHVPSRGLFGHNLELNQIWSSPDHVMGRGYYNPHASYISSDGYLVYTEKTSSTLRLMRMDIVTGVSSLLRDLTSEIPSGSFSSTTVTRIKPSTDGRAIIYLNNAASIIVSSQPTANRYDMFENQLMRNEPSLHFGDIELRYTMQFRTYYEDKVAGFSYRMQDNRNMYRVESDRKVTKLYKITNGVKQLAAQANMSMKVHTPYNVRIQAYGNQHKVYINGVPLIDHSDATYTSGSYGPYTNTDAAFSQMSVTDLSNETSSTRNTSIIGSPMDYAIYYDDPEHDPRIPQRDRWTYVHSDPDKFLNAGDGNSGSSANHNQMYTLPVIMMDKVGLYEVSFQAEDDPHASYRFPQADFDQYRKKSNTHREEIIVHRKPVADFTILQQASGSIIWDDISYDPDRWLSELNYSTENTGIDYQQTRGIMERRYYYIAPDGSVVQQQLLTPDQTGSYTVALAVKDEYGAWSDWLEQSLDVTIVVPPDDPPIAGFTANPLSTYRGMAVTINSTASDVIDGGRQNLQHWYYIRNLSLGTAETLQSTVRTSWDKSFNSMGTFEIRQVVQDSMGQTDQAIRQVTISNQLPTAVVTTPSSSNPNSPTRLEESQRTFHWTYADADSDPQLQFQVRIYQHDGVLLLDSGLVSSASKQWKASTALPDDDTLYIQTRVHDGYDWGSWSTARFFYIETNQPPEAGFTISPDTIYEGDTVQITSTALDPDGDLLDYIYTLIRPDGFSLSYTSENPSFRVVQVGTYSLSQRVTDPSGENDTVIQTFPVATLDITGNVDHTERWKEIHAEHNNAVHQFYSGEMFMLRANVTDHPIDTVDVDFEGKQVDGITLRLNTHLNSVTNAAWTGNLYDEAMTDPATRLGNNAVKFIFTVAYTNGTIKQDHVEIQIIGSVYDVLNYHRSN